MYDSTETIETDHGCSGGSAETPLDITPFRYAEDRRDMIRALAPGAAEIAMARDIWHAAGPIDGSPAETALLLGGLSSGEACSLRHGRMATEGCCRRAHVGHALIGALQDVDARVVGVQGLPIAVDGRRIDRGQPDLTLGRTSGSAVRLTPAAETIALAVGLEQGLALSLVLPESAVWVVPDVTNLATVRLPAIVRRVVLCLDHDVPVAIGESIAVGLRASGIEAQLRRPACASYVEDWLCACA